MLTEIQVLFWISILTFGLILIQGIQVPLNFGFKWGLGNRDTPQQATPFMNRINRTLGNQIQALSIALPVLIAIIVMPEAQTSLTAIGATVFLLGRVGFAFCYLIGIPYLRSVIWFVGLVGWMIMAYGLAIAIL